jgi:hypothetical protein
MKEEKMQLRQGDVLIERVNEIEKNATPTPETLLVRGEGRYHGHFITGEAEVFENPDFGVENTTSHFLNIEQEAVLKHLNTETKKPTQEHGDVTLKPGKYRVIRQREFNPYARAIEIIRD